MFLKEFIKKTLRRFVKGSWIALFIGLIHDFTIDQVSNSIEATTEQWLPGSSFILDAITYILKLILYLYNIFNNLPIIQHFILLKYIILILFFIILITISTKITSIIYSYLKSIKSPWLGKYDLNTCISCGDPISYNKIKNLNSQIKKFNEIDLEIIKKTEILEKLKKKISNLEKKFNK